MRENKYNVHNILLDNIKKNFNIIQYNCKESKLKKEFSDKFNMLINFLFDLKWLNVEYRKENPELWKQHSLLLSESSILISKSIELILTSYDLLMINRYVSSKILIRSLFENLVMLIYLYKNPKKSERYKKYAGEKDGYKKYREFSITNMMANLYTKEEFKIIKEEVYSPLSEYVHPNLRIDNILEKPKNKDDSTIEMYDNIFEKQFDENCFKDNMFLIYLFRELIKIYIKYIEKYYHKKIPDKLSNKFEDINNKLNIKIGLSLVK